MIELGLIGYPLGHSLSPAIHAAALRACGLDGRYSLFPIPPGEIERLQALLARVRAGEIAGLNVTIPHKQIVIELLDDLTPAADGIGAVNTIYCAGGRLTGDNTDAPGFLADLKQFLGPASRGAGVPRALVLGAGGSARAVVYALLHEGWHVTLAARRLEQAKELRDGFHSDRLEVVESTLSRLDLSQLSLVVNTTPAGMAPDDDRSPWPEGRPLPAYAAIYDLVYNPRETRFVREARSQGLRADTGLGMLIEQAALAFEIWTGHRPSRHILRAAVAETAH